MTTVENDIINHFCDHCAQLWHGDPSVVQKLSVLGQVFVDRCNDGTVLRFCNKKCRIEYQEKLITEVPSGGVSNNTN